MPACPTRTRKKTPASATPSSARSATWGWAPARRSTTSASTKNLSTHPHTAPPTTTPIENTRPPPAVGRKLGRKGAGNVKLARVVPGSGLVKEQAEREGLHHIFKAAGFEWREPGCSMCLAMNADRVEPGERCASTSNRNFEGRRGTGGRTHLVSPAMAAAAAVHGHFVDIRAFA